MASAAGDKAPDAFRTIGELSTELGVAQHILRYWETKFSQLKPLQRAGNRRYYRPADITLARRIHRLLNEEGYTVKGVQKLLREKDGERQAAAPSPTDTPPAEIAAAPSLPHSGIDLDRLMRLRDRLNEALAE